MAATASAQLIEARAEAKRLRLEIQERADEGGADDDDQLAMQQIREDLQVKLDRSEQHLAYISLYLPISPYISLGEARPLGAASAGGGAQAGQGEMWRRYREM